MVISDSRRFCRRRSCARTPCIRSQPWRPSSRSTNGASSRRLLPTCRALGVGFVAYSPLGRGFLAGRFESPSELHESDFRHHYPRVEEDHRAANLRLVEHLREIASELEATPSQVALAWLLAQGDDIVPIPGTRRQAYLEENVRAASLTLADEVLQRLEREFPVGSAAGERYPEWAMEWIDRGTPASP